MNDLLSWLLVGHMAGDYLFQTRWMAERKATSMSALTAHSAVYACAVWLASLPALPWKGLSPFCVLLVFASHAVIDRPGLVRWWRRYVTKSEKEWLGIMTDQALHVVFLALACLLERQI